MKRAQTNGALAKLAIALHWQCRDHRFESGKLHHEKDLLLQVLFQYNAICPYRDNQGGYSLRKGRFIQPFCLALIRKKTDFHVDTPLRGWAKLRLEEVREMLRIGEFSKLSMLTVKALRYYERRGCSYPQA